MQMIMVWRATKWFVRVTLGDTLVAEIPFDSFVKLPAVRYAIALSQEHSDLGTAPKELQPGSRKEVSPIPE
jgi:hypothetical protein